MKGVIKYVKAGSNEETILNYSLEFSITCEDYDVNEATFIEINEDTGKIYFYIDVDSWVEAHQTYYSTSSYSYDYGYESDYEDLDVDGTITINVKGVFSGELSDLDEGNVIVLYAEDVEETDDDFEHDESIDDDIYVDSSSVEYYFGADDIEVYVTLESN